MVLVSLLVDQLFGLFLIFFGRPKKNLSSIRSFLFTLLNFLSSLFWKCGFGQSLGRPIVRSISHFLKKTGQKIQESEQKRSETGQIFFWSTKKMRNRPDNWSTKRLTKTTWTGLFTVKSSILSKLGSIGIFLENGIFLWLHKVLIDTEIQQENVHQSL